MANFQSSPAQSRLDNVGKILKQATHGGEVAPGWRTRDALVSNDRQRLSAHAGDEKGDQSSHSAISLESSFASALSFTPRDSAGSTSSESDQEIPALLQEYWCAYPHMRRLPPEEYLEYDDMEVDGDDSTACIGSGGQGQIWRCVHESPRHPRQLVAVKVSYKETVLEEYLIARRFEHRCLLKPIGYALHPEHEVGIDSHGDEVVTTKWLFLVSYEYCLHGDLRSFFSKFPWRSREQAFLTKMVHGIVSGLEAIHRAGWIHCDIKPENILVHEDLTIRVGDYGARRTCSVACSTLTLKHSRYAPENWRAYESARHTELSRPRSFRRLVPTARSPRLHGED